MVELFNEEGYDATHTKLDTKRYYIPHTRQRGYLIAVRKEFKARELDKRWKDIVLALERPAVKCLDAFMLSTDDPRVIRGNSRMLAEISLGGKDGKAGRTDWTRVRNFQR
jgi:site-specific DNA-cytosine methylase